jgi:endoglucanase
MITMTAMTFAENLNPGWNLGNTLDSCGPRVRDVGREIAWGNPVTTQEMINTVAAAGFKTLRVPVSWHDHIQELRGTNYELRIDGSWMDRVEEVVNYGLNAGMYVIVNIHHDDGKEYIYPDAAHYESSSRFVKSVWAQISERFKGYGSNLIFEAMNEPRLKGVKDEWNLHRNPPLYKEAIETLNKLNQDFLNTVRSSGGNNAGRYLLFSGIAASPESVLHDSFALPTDTADDKLIVSVHSYRPWNFAMAALEDPKSVSCFDRTKPESTRDIDGFMSDLHDKFIAFGIPVILGEYGAIDKNNNTADRAEYYEYFTAAAKKHRMPCIAWDNGIKNNPGDGYALLDRRTLKWHYPEILDAIMRNK